MNPISNKMRHGSSPMKTEVIPLYRRRFLLSQQQPILRHADWDWPMAQLEERRLEPDYRIGRRRRPWSPRNNLINPIDALATARLDGRNGGKELISVDSASARYRRHSETWPRIYQANCSAYRHTCKLHITRHRLQTSLNSIVLRFKSFHCFK